MPQDHRGWPNILQLVRTTSLKVLGKPGATAGAGLAGGTTSGAPTTGQFEVGDVVVATTTGHVYVCTVAGTPGTWVDAGTAGGLTSPLSTKGDLWGYGSGDVRFPVGTDGYVVTADSTQSLGVKWAAAAAGSSGLFSAYLCYQDQQTSGTNGGTFTSGAWRTRVLNTEVADTGSQGSVASNQITLAAGTYAVRAVAPAHFVNGHQIRLQNITAGTTLLTGSSEFASGSSGNPQSSSTLAGLFTLGSSSALEVQHQCQTTRATDGLGVPCSFGTEVYATIELWKE